MIYTAKSQLNRHFELFDSSDQSLGRVDYTSWFSIDATITMTNGDVYEIAPSNFWHTSLEITKNGVVVGGLKTSWLMNVVIQMEGGPAYAFRRKGFMNPYYALTTEEDRDIVVLRLDIQWLKFGVNYDIETDDNYTETADPAFILFLVYCANFMHSRSGGGAVAAAAH